ncbi:MAG: FAD:protein FMN transferase, partial [Planctomycetes bacterium]|nr:FAD:protein FMN transferase [Planctomycetota bacterium]
MISRPPENLFRANHRLALLPPFLALLAFCLWTALGSTREGPRGAHAAESGGWERVERRVAVMGTWLRISLEAPTRAEGLAACERALRAIEEAEARLSTWRDDSELAQLNAAPVDEPIEVSPLLRAELERACEWSRETSGAFDPALAPLVAAWSLRTGGDQPSATEFESARDACGLRCWAFEPSGVRRLHERAGFEEGAFGKGASLDAALEAIEELSWRSLSIDLGGQLLEARHAGLVRRLVAHPDDRGTPV